MLDSQLATPAFLKLYERYAHQPRINEVLRLAEPPSREKFWNELRPAGYPFIYRAEGIRKISLAETLAEMKSMAGDALIKVRQATYHSPKEYTEAREQVPISLAEYIDGLTSSSSDTRYAGNQALPATLSRNFGARVPSFLDDSAMEPPAFWLGPSGAVTPLHKDSTDNFAFHILGEKRWTLFPLQDVPRLAMSRFVTNEEIDFATSPVDVEHPDLSLFPQFAQAVPVRVDVRPGEVLYLPAGWGHFVRNLALTVMINFWMTRQFFRQSLGL